MNLCVCYKPLMVKTLARLSQKTSASLCVSIYLLSAAYGKKSGSQNTICLFHYKSSSGITFFQVIVIIEEGN